MTTASFKHEKFLGVKSIEFIFSVFSESLFTFTHIYIYISFSSSLIFSISSSRSGPLQKRFVSSANKMGINKLDTDGKSLM